MTKHWIVVASAEHVRRGHAGGFIQAGHGKEAPLRRMKRSDGIVCYSPTETLGGKDRLQAFTAIGLVKDETIYAVDMTPDFRPFRRNVTFWESEPTQIAPLLDELALTRGHRHWGAKFRFGLVEIGHGDFKKIANAMRAQSADDGGPVIESVICPLWSRRRQMSKYDFRPYVPSPDYPRVAGLGRDPYEHAQKMAANPHVQKLLLEPWAALYERPFVGVTTDGNPVQGLYAPHPNGAPVEAMTNAAAQLLTLLSPEQRKALLFPIGGPDWRRWNNTEIYFYQYGLRLEELSETARDGVLAVVRVSLSQSGYEKTRDVMRLNLFLGELLGNTKVFGEFSYNFSIFGMPSTTEPWGWQLMGHHLALNCLVVDGQLVLSPTFMGAEPNFADTGLFAHVHLFQDEENRGLALIHALSADQQRQAIVNHSILGKDQPPGRWHPADHLHLGGARQDNRIIPYEGIRAAALSSDQRRRLLELIAAFVEPMPAGPMKARMDEIEHHLGETHFCWIGGTGEHSPFYYRIQSPVVMIEFDHHSGVYLTNDKPEKFHVHTLVRTPNGNDYGVDLLRLHYEHAHR